MTTSISLIIIIIIQRTTAFCDHSQQYSTKHTSCSTLQTLFISLLFPASPKSCREFGNCYSRLLTRWMDILPIIQTAVSRCWKKRDSVTARIDKIWNYGGDTRPRNLCKNLSCRPTVLINQLPVLFQYVLRSALSEFSAIQFNSVALYPPVLFVAQWLSG